VLPDSAALAAESPAHEQRAASRQHGTAGQSERQEHVVGIVGRAAHTGLDAAYRSLAAVVIATIVIVVDLHAPGSTTTSSVHTPIGSQAAIIIAVIATIVVLSGRGRQATRRKRGGHGRCRGS
jgi:hypothetical protein